MRIGLALCAALTMIVASPTVGCARPHNVPQGDWVFLGMRAVSDRLDHDVIAATSTRGEFRSIKLTVLRAAVDFHRVVVHFRNGGSQEIELRHTIPAGGESRVIDLTGNQRTIARVEFWYDAKTIRGKQAAVRLYGIR